MASIRTKHLTNGKSAYLVRFRSADGHERSRQFARRRDAEHFAHLIEVDRAQGSFTRAGHTRVSVVLDRYGHLLPDHDADLIRSLEPHRPAQAVE